MSYALSRGPSTKLVHYPFNYDLSIDYTRLAEIPLPLVAETAVWAAEYLRQAGIAMRIE